MKPLIFDFPTPSSLGQKVRAQMGAEEGKVLVRSFPDGETYLRVESPVKGREVIINASLVHPNDWILNLLFLANALRAQGAKRVGLLAPYLAYMRQDKIFQPGEALTSKTFATLLSASFDYLITVDPHLHRYHRLEEIYSIPSQVVQAAPLISQWIQKNVKNPFLIGPDQESTQWVKEIAQNAPYLILQKVRHATGDVEIVCPLIQGIKGKTVVLVDDIISSGVTILQTMSHLKEQGISHPMCIAIHPLFSADSYEKLLNTGIQIITCNSISHPSNQIDLTPLLVPALQTI